MGKIQSGAPQAKSGRIPQQTPPSDNVELKFSFKHVDLIGNPKFTVNRCAQGYLEKFLGRLRDLNRITVREFRTNRSSALRAHTLEWQKTSEKQGFTCLNEQLRAEEAWQFEITSNAHGRVHGLLVDDTFFIVWIDPEHLLYS